MRTNITSIKTLVKALTIEWLQISVTKTELKWTPATRLERKEIMHLFNSDQIVRSTIIIVTLTLLISGKICPWFFLWRQIPTQTYIPILTYTSVKVVFEDVHSHCQTQTPAFLPPLTQWFPVGVSWGGQRLNFLPFHECFQDIFQLRLIKKLCFLLVPLSEYRHSFIHKMCHKPKRIKKTIPTPSKRPCPDQENVGKYLLRMTRETCTVKMQSST